MKDFVGMIKEFNQLADNKEEYNHRKAMLYVGLVLEEVGEMLVSLDENFVVDDIDELAHGFKTGLYDDLYKHKVNRKEFLDAAVDIAVVSIGAGICIGSDINGACLEVMNTNLAKYPLVEGVRVVVKDENGKVKKPEGWKPPELGKFLK